jgi:hypothetical protein
MLRVMDLYILDGMKILYVTAYSILKTIKPTILIKSNPKYVFELLTEKFIEFDEKKFFSHFYSFTINIDSLNNLVKKNLIDSNSSKRVITTYTRPKIVKSNIVESPQQVIPIHNLVGGSLVLFKIFITNKTTRVLVLHKNRWI